MSSAVASITPFNEPSRPRRLRKVAGWLVGTALIVILLNVLGIDVTGWISELWDTLTAISFASIFAGFTIAGTFVYVYLFLSVPGSFDIELGNLGDHWVLALLSFAGLVFLLVLLYRAFKRKAQQLWVNAKQGGAILAKPRRFLLRVVLPSFVAWICTISITGVFLNAYGIPVTFHTIMSVMGGNSLANTVTATPGGIGITQAVNAASLSDVTDTATATAYSIGQQLIISAWHVVFATIVVVWAFGWSGGKTLVADSYGDAKVKVAEQKAARAEKKATKREEGVEGGLLHHFRHNGDRKDEQA